MHWVLFNTRNTEVTTPRDYIDLQHDDTLVEAILENQVFDYLTRSVTVIEERHTLVQKNTWIQLLISVEDVYKIVCLDYSVWIKCKQ